MAHATLIKFGYPASLVAESDHWAILVRPAQVTLGSLVLCSRSEATAYGDLPDEAFVDQHRMTALIERLLSEFVRYERINYLMLMMVDPHVHFHVIPRYQGSRSFAGVDFGDSAWPGAPDLSRSQPAPAALPEELRHLIAAKSL